MGYDEETFDAQGVHAGRFAPDWYYLYYQGKHGGFGIVTWNVRLHPDVVVPVDEEPHDQRVQLLHEMDGLLAPGS